jgi:hypothetical protein
MKIIRRSKIILWQKFYDFTDNYHVDRKDDEDMCNYLLKLCELRNGILVNADLSEQENVDTANYVIFLKNEEYEKLINYKVLEDL